MGDRVGRTGIVFLAMALVVLGPGTSLSTLAGDDKDVGKELKELGKKIGRTGKKVGREVAGVDDSRRE